MGRDVKKKQMSDGGMVICIDRFGKQNESQIPHPSSELEIILKSFFYCLVLARFYYSHYALNTYLFNIFSTLDLKKISEN
jgi:hypothetical protein